MPPFATTDGICVLSRKRNRAKTAQFITPGITPKFRRPQVRRLPALVVDVRCGSREIELRPALARFPSTTDIAAIACEVTKSANKRRTSKQTF